MNKTFSLVPGLDRFSPWLATLLGIIVIKAVLSVSLISVPFVFSYSGISYLLLLLLATIFSIRNGIQNTLRARPFWVLLAAGCGLWAFQQSLDLYYELGLKIDVPNNSIADEVLFFHLVPLMAAAATLPTLHIPDGKQYGWILNSLLILGFWAFMYGFMVAPFKYFSPSPSSYGVRFDILYAVENIVLVLMLIVAALRAQPPWKLIYLHLLGASALYALSSTVANIAIDAGGYVNGKLYGLGLTASVCWLVWIPLYARAVPETEASTIRFADRQDSQISVWAMLSVVMIAIPMVWELFHRNENPDIRTLRLIIATAAILMLAGGAYLKEYLDRRAALSSLSGQLIRAQEEERCRIAREIHDDYQQRLALIAMDLEKLGQGLSGDQERSSRLHELWNRVGELCSDLHFLSHRLHSSTLDSLGLVAALRSLCAEVGDRHSIEVSFVDADVPRNIPGEVALCLFRVTQEALQNVTRHSLTDSAEVRVEGQEKNVHLTVSDKGAGFDPAMVARQDGIGIRSIEERVHLVKGQFTIHSRPGHGTQIDVWAPIKR